MVPSFATDVPCNPVCYKLYSLYPLIYLCLHVSVYANISLSMIVQYCRPGLNKIATISHVQCKL